MRRNFLQVSQFLQDKFPELKGHVQGANYPPPPLVEVIQRLVSYLQIIGLAWMILGGETLLRFIGYGGGTTQRPLPAWYWTIQRNGMQIGMILFFVVPQILAKFTVNGAFEVYLDGEEIFSKLKENRMPEVDDLVKPLENMLGATE